MLAADDELILRESLIEVVEVQGFSSLQATNGEEAVALLRHGGVPLDADHHLSYGRIGDWQGICRASIHDYKAGINDIPVYPAISGGKAIYASSLGHKILTK